MAKRILTEEYDALREILRDENFSDSNASKRLIGSLKSLLANDGPDKTHATALKTLQKSCKGGFFSRGNESEAILKLAGDATHLDKKAAALKTLRHLRLMKKFGGHCLWILSLPTPYRKWLTDEFSGLNTASLTSKLTLSDEYFSKSEQKNLLISSQTVAKWANKSMAICSNTQGIGGEKADTLIKRWFADASQSDADITAIKTKLVAGFQKIAVAATSGKMIFTDNPFHRGTTYENSEAYVWDDRLNVIYVEKEFFGTGNILSGSVNWARILLHELSHSQLNTDDVRYAWHANSISPDSASFPSADALNNADSWAYFAADANGALRQNERDKALVRP